MFSADAGKFRCGTGTFTLARAENRGFLTQSWIPGREQSVPSPDASLVALLALERVKFRLPPTKLAACS